MDARNFHLHVLRLRGRLGDRCRYYVLTLVARERKLQDEIDRAEER